MLDEALAVEDTFCVWLKLCEFLLSLTSAVVGACDFAFLWFDEEVGCVELKGDVLLPEV